MLRDFLEYHIQSGRWILMIDHRSISFSPIYTTSPVSLLHISDTPFHHTAGTWWNLMFCLPLAAFRPAGGILCVQALRDADSGECDVQ